MTRIQLSRWPIIPPLSSFLGGNQRDTDRLRAQARHAKKNTGERKEGDVKSRNENDANALAAKIAKKKAAQEAGLDPKSVLKNESHMKQLNQERKKK